PAVGQTRIFRLGDPVRVNLHRNRSPDPHRPLTPNHDPGPEPQPESQSLPQSRFPSRNPNSKALSPKPTRAEPRAALRPEPSWSRVEPGPSRVSVHRACRTAVSGRGLPPSTCGDSIDGGRTSMQEASRAD